LLQEILSPRPKLLGFIGQVQPLKPMCQINTQVINDEGHRKEGYSMAWACCRKKKGVFQAIFPIQIFSLGLNRGKIGERYE
jgi:hypothetical protein